MWVSKINHAKPLTNIKENFINNELSDISDDNYDNDDNGDFKKFLDSYDKNNKNSFSITEFNLNNNIKNKLIDEDENEIKTIEYNENKNHMNLIVN